MQEIQIFLNGESQSVPNELNIDQLLERFSLPRQRIAVELNSSVVRRAEWPETLIRDGDRIEVVHFVGGG